MISHTVGCDICRLFLLLYAGFLIDFASSKNVQPTRLKRSTLWSTGNYPNPWKEPGKCGKSFLPSFICDPDQLLTREQVKSLDDALWEHGRNGPCLCEICHIGKHGIPVGIALMDKASLTIRTDKNSLEEFAEQLRNNWTLGNCDNDVLILVTSDGGSISFGKVAKHLLRNSKIAHLDKDSFPRKKDLRFQFIEEILNEIHKYGRESTRNDVNMVPDVGSITWLNENGLEPNVSAFFAPVSSLPGKDTEKTISKTNDRFEGNTSLETGNITEIVKSTKKLTLANSPINPYKKTFTVAEEYDDFGNPINEKGLPRATIILIGVLSVIVVCLIALVLIIWYYRTKTGNIETGVFYKKNKPEVKPSDSIKATKYEPCKTEEPSNTI